MVVTFVIATRSTFRCERSMLLLLLDEYIFNGWISAERSKSVHCELLISMLQSMPDHILKETSIWS